MEGQRRREKQTRREKPNNGSRETGENKYRNTIVVKVEGKERYTKTNEGRQREKEKSSKEK